MTTCDRYQSWLVEALYDELDRARRAELDAHLSECADCTALLCELRSTAALMHRRQRPDPGTEYWDGYWRRLEELFVRENSALVDSSRFARRRSLGSWGYRVAAAVAVLAAGMWIGRTVLAPSSNPETPRVAIDAARGDSPVDTTKRAPAGGRGLEAQPNRDEQVARAATSDRAAPSNSGVVLASADEDALRYIDRSQLLLFAVLNADPEDEASFDEQKTRAGELVRTAASVREGSNDRRLQELVVQLEFILREIAHLEAGSEGDGVEAIRSRVNREGVLLRINLEQMRAVQSTPAPKNGAID